MYLWHASLHVHTWWWWWWCGALAIKCGCGLRCCHGDPSLVSNALQTCSQKQNARELKQRKSHNQTQISCNTLENFRRLPIRRVAAFWTLCVRDTIYEMRPASTEVKKSGLEITRAYTGSWADPVIRSSDVMKKSGESLDWVDDHTMILSRGHTRVLMVCLRSRVEKCCIGSYISSVLMGHNSD